MAGVINAICDMHGHFLPGMDDGSKDSDMSVQMLRESYRQGVRRMFATPHYYPVETVDAFLSRREQAARRLMECIQQLEEPLPEFLLGAEVAYHTGLSQEPQLEQLCLGRSRYLLLEMPFRSWGSEVVREVSTICASRGLIPILAHIERYLSIQRTETLQKLLNLNVLVQMNGEALLKFGSRSQARSMLKHDVVQLLGSDCHNLESRCPNMGPAVVYLEKKNMHDVLSQMARLSQQIFAEAAGEELY